MSIQNQQYQPKKDLNAKETAILEYIKKNENDPKKLTINQVSSAMDKMGICSRLTTNKVIFNLINLNIIRDEKIGNKFHHLKINHEYYSDSNKLEEALLKSQIQKALEPFKPLLKSKKMEVQLVNKVKGETDIIIGIESKVEKTKVNDLYIPKPLDQYPTDDVFNPKQLQQMAMDQQRKSNKKTIKDLMDYARKELRDKTEHRKSNKDHYLSYLDESIAKMIEGIAVLKAAIKRDKAKLTPEQIEETQSYIQQFQSTLKELEKDKKRHMDYQKPQKNKFS